MTSSEFLIKFGQDIRRLRKMKGLSQVEMASALDLDYRNYQNIEAGRISMRFETLFKILNGLDLQILYFSKFAQVTFIEGSKPDQPYMSEPPVEVKCTKVLDNVEVRLPHGQV